MLHVDIPTRADIDSLFRNRGSARVTLYLTFSVLLKTVML
jgi:hypothetical protein